MTAAVPIIRNEGEGERRWFYGGGVHTWKATSKETDGALMLFEDQMSQGKATPLHTHDEDEALYVLEGELLVHVDGHNHRVGPCGFAFAPRGVVHAFLVTSPLARLLCWQTPASAEAFYRDASERADPTSDPDGPVDFARVITAAKQTGGMQIVGPPPFGQPDGTSAPALAGSDHGASAS